ncbi:MAG: hypothetical protein A2023_06060 [Sulfuricurvum sp. GWF2_44_89]|uniref:Uncharacterized protein n=1 Tax=Sulfuricurvum kujiense TaxID=148813 RepID=A0A2D3WJG2_9BACT|nr:MULTISPECIES: hypothetical protein [Sulfuricurvum]OHD78306.1 MAG: hypothetical protein A2023_06060 [Sulfuricurvum sp. GWF2_44_89]OHD92008.1 MAG: hypothetical protein A2517_00610 [Sulfuricurvum sp. RIFOXYD12_FULL_44_77]DAB39180.1 MAG TPA: hypothetical protein CFH83_02080 [Sulfuricurvum kujiense]
MEPLLYLLVSEGPTDFLVISEISKRISLNTGKKIEIRALAPQKDATTGRYDDFGWKEVRRWCKLYGKNIDPTLNSLEAFAARRKNWMAEIAISGANGLIIQMDTDIVDEITDVLPPYSGSTKRAQKHFCNKAFLTWLGESIKPSNLYFLHSVHSTENWVLATHDRTELIFSDLPPSFDFEMLTTDEVIGRLNLLAYQTYVKSKRLKLNKDLSLYSKYAKKISDKLHKVRTECDEVNGLCNQLEL